MAKPSATDSSLRTLVNDFVGRLVSAVEADATNRARQMVITALGAGGLPRRRGRPPKYATGFAGASAALGTTFVSAAPSRRRQKQLCPVPGCTNPAAPVFGMVCAKHKDVPKAMIKKYREARRAAKVKGSRRGPGKAAPKNGRAAASK
jgi:hypothetical protein